MNWQVGDLALCVDASACRCGCGGRGTLVEGHIYPVFGIVVHPLRLGLVVGALPAPMHNSIGAARFRKIRPDEHEACEDEFVILLNRTKQPVERVEALGAVRGSVGDALQARSGALRAEPPSASQAKPPAAIARKDAQ